MTTSKSKWHRVYDEYIEGIMAGEIPACEWVRLAVERELRERNNPPVGSTGQKYYFDNRRADHICDFFAACVAPGRDGQQRFNPLDWQVFMLRVLFGWVYDTKDGRQLRRFRTAYFSAARKSGKSVLAAVIGIYILTLEPLDRDFTRFPFNLQAFSAATKRDQAKMVFNAAVAIIDATPNIEKTLGIKALTHLIKTSRGGEFVALPRDTKSQDGFAPAFASVDELHEHPDEAQMKVLRSGQGSNANALMFITTTAGLDATKYWKEYQTQIEDVLKQKGNPRHDVFGLIFTIDKEDDWSDPSVWAKANPALIGADGDESTGVTYLSDIQSDFEEAQVSTRSATHFEIKRMNRPQTSGGGFFNIARLEQSARPGLTMESLKGDRPVFLGVDLGSVSDLSAIAAVRLQMDGHELVGVECAGATFVPESRLTMSEGAYGKLLTKFRDDGSEDMIVTPGDTTDYRAATDYAIRLARLLGVRAIGVDAWQAGMMAQYFAETGVQTTVVQQNRLTLTEPLTLLEALVLDGRVVTSGSQMAMWNWGNVVVKTIEDAATELLLFKKKSDKAKIDLVAATLNALVVGLAWHREFQPVVLDPRALINRQAGGRKAA